MKILITGALGHIGSKLIRLLPQQFDNVELIMVDNLSTQRYCSLFDLSGTARYSFVESNVKTVDWQRALPR
jgi:dTDP-D-glucose 4,6-dehydratase